ncbi:MAG TPA: hypothetical protein VF283_15940 [Bryobacteraceae bacterium]
MEPNGEVYRPSRLYLRLAWAALASAAVCALFALRAPWAGIPSGLCAITAAGLFWLATRPLIRLGDSEFYIGERTIDWREVREINTSSIVSRLVVSPLLLNLKLTNRRGKTLVFPGEPEQIARLMFQLRKKSYLASFDGVPFRQYWAGSSVEIAKPDSNGPPIHVVSTDDEEEIERMYQKLKSVGHIDSKKSDEE